MTNRICKACRHSICKGKIPIFNDLTEDELDIITGVVIHKFYNKGDRIFSEMEMSDKFMVVNRGSVKIYKHTIDGKDQILDIIREGDFTGELDLFGENTIYGINAEALEKTIICTIDKKSIQELIINNPSIGVKLLANLNKQIFKLRSLIQNLATNSSELRMIDLLIKLYYENDEDTRLELNLTREELGNYCGLTRETVSRKLSQLEKEGTISLEGYRVIIINDIENLKDLHKRIK